MSALLYTIPSLALFQLLVPLHGHHLDDGRDRTRLLHAGRPVPQHLGRPAGAPRPRCSKPPRGMGLTARQVLWRFELPLGRALRSSPGCGSRSLDDHDRDHRAFLLPQGLGVSDLPRTRLPTPFKTEIYAAGGHLGLALVCDALLVGLRRALIPWDSAGAA